MSYYSLNEKPIKRTEGRSFAQKLAYIARAKLTWRSETYGVKTFNEEGKAGHLTGRTILPDGVPEDYLDLEYFANAVENFEEIAASQRFKGHPTDPIKNARSERARAHQINTAQTAQDGTFALPKELDYEDWVAICDAYIEECYKEKGFLARYDIHYDEDGNPHCHYLIPKRKWDHKTGNLSLQKEREYFQKAALKSRRYRLAEIINERFVEKGINRVWRAESYKDLGLDVEPTSHEGAAARELKAKGKKSRIIHDNDQTRQRNIERFIQNPVSLLKKIATFRREVTQEVLKEDIAKELAHDAENIARFFETIRSSLKRVQKEAYQLNVPIIAVLNEHQNDSKQMRPGQAHSQFEQGSAQFIEQDTPEDSFSGEGRFSGTYSNKHAAKVQGEAFQQKQAKPAAKPVDKFIFDLLQEDAVFTKEDVMSDVRYQLDQDHDLIDLFRVDLGLPEFSYAQSGQEGQSAHAYNTSKGGSPLDVNEATDLEIAFIAEKMAERFFKNKSLVHIHHDDITGSVYSTKEYMAKEEALLEKVKNLNQPRRYGLLRHREILNTNIKKAVDRYNRKSVFVLNDKQIEAVYHLCEAGTSIRCLSGKAGTGKTTVMKLVSDLYEAEDYRVRGVSFQGSAVEVLEKDIEKPCQTIDSLIRQWRLIDAYDQGKKTVDEDIGGGVKKVTRLNKQKIEALREKSTLTKKDVIIVDEANMVGSHLWQPLIDRVQKSGATLLVVGDQYQAKARGKGDIHRGIERIAGARELTDIVRQNKQWARQASAHLADHNLEHALLIYQEKGHLHWFETKQEALQAQAKHYADLYFKDKNSLAPAHKNKDVEKLNGLIREELKSRGFFKNKTYHVGTKPWSVKDQIIFNTPDNTAFNIKNHSSNTQEVKKIGIKNGNRGVIQEIKKGGEVFVVKLESGRVIEFNTSKYKNFAHGYSITVNRSEGVTIQNEALRLDRAMGANLAYVGMTRHKQELDIFLDRETFKDLKDVVNCLGYGAVKGLVSDYAPENNDSEAAERITTYLKTLCDIGDLKQKIHSWCEEYDLPMSVAPDQELYREKLFQKECLAKEISEKWQEHKAHAHQHRLRKDWIAEEAGLKKPLLSELDQKRETKLLAYKELRNKSRGLWEHICADEPRFAFHCDHKHYQLYKETVQMRNKLAFELRDDLENLSRFFILRAQKDSSKLKDYWGNEVDRPELGKAGIVRNAEQHIAYLDERKFEKKLNPDQKELVRKIKLYKEFSSKTAALWKDLKPYQNQLAYAKYLPESMKTGYEEGLAACQGMAEKRNALAYEIAHHPEHRKFLERYRIDARKLRFAEKKESLTQLIKEYKEIAFDDESHQNFTHLNEQALNIAQRLQGSLEDRAVGRMVYGMLEGQEINTKRLKLDAYLVNAFDMKDLQKRTLGRYLTKYTAAEEEASLLYKELQDKRKNLLQRYTIPRRYLECQLFRKLRKHRPFGVSAQDEEIGAHFKAVIEQVRGLYDIYQKSPSLHIDSSPISSFEKGYGVALHQSYVLLKEGLRPTSSKTTQALFEDIISYVKQDYFFKEKLQKQTDKSMREFFMGRESLASSDDQHLYAQYEKTCNSKAITGHMLHQRFKHAPDAYKAMKGYEARFIEDDHSIEIENLAQSYSPGQESRAAELLAWKDLEKEHNKTAKWYHRVTASDRALQSHHLNESILKIDKFMKEQRQDHTHKLPLAKLKKLQAYTHAYYGAAQIWNSYTQASQYEKRLFGQERDLLLLNLKRKFIAHARQSDNQNREAFSTTLRVYRKCSVILAKEYRQEEPNEHRIEEQEGILRKTLEDTKLSEKDIANYLKRYRKELTKAEELQQKILGEGTFETLKANPRDLERWSAFKETRNELAAELYKEDKKAPQQLKEICGRDFRLKENAEKELRFEEQRLQKQKAEPSTQNQKEKPVFKRKAFKRPEFTRADAEMIVDRLIDRIEDLATYYWHDLTPKPSGNQIFFYNEKGKVKVSVCINGHQKGAWKDFRTDEGGHALQLFALSEGRAGHLSGTDYWEIIKKAANYVGHTPENDHLDNHQDDESRKAFEEQRKEDQDRKSALKEAEAQKKRQENINSANKVYNFTKPIQGTLVEKYLTEHRKVSQQTIDTLGSNSDIRFNPSYYNFETKQSHPCMMAFARDERNQITGYQAFYLNPETGNKLAKSQRDKLSKGTISGSFVKIQEDIAINVNTKSKDKQTLFVAEGVETALSLKEAGVEGTILAGLGIHNFKNLQLGKEDHVIICKDHDEEGKPSHSIIQKAKLILEEKGASVTIIQPEGEGNDFNDVLKRDGRQAVQEYFKGYVKQESSASYAQEVEAENQPSAHPSQQHASGDKACDDEENKSQASDQNKSILSDEDRKFLSHFASSEAEMLELKPLLDKHKAHNKKIANQELGKDEGMEIDF